MSSICPVCLEDVEVVDGVVDTHPLAGPPRHGRTEPRFCPMSGRPPFEWSERSTRLAVPNRSGGRCEYCGVLATNMHHRKPLSQGGLWTPANILHMCGSGTTGCHGYFTHEPNHAYELGVSVHRNENPADIPVRTPNGQLWLSVEVAPPVPGWAQ